MCIRDSAKAAEDSAAPAVMLPAMISDCKSALPSIVDTSTRPVSRQMMTVSQKVPVMETSA